MSVIFRKTKPSEIIEVGDVLMLSPENQYVTRAIRDESKLNERLVVGICVESDNETPVAIVVNGGKSKAPTGKFVHINGGSASVNVIPINGGNSELRPREYVAIESNNIQVVNTVHHIDIGDKLTISDAHPGKAEAVSVLNQNEFDNRSIGKVIKYTENKNKVVALLNIE